MKFHVIFWIGFLSMLIVTSLTNAQPITYQYNPANQLMVVQHSACTNITYTYDANGNRTERIVQPCPEISGYILDDTGTGIADVRLQGFPGSPVTGPGGIYSVKVAPGWSGIVTPQKEDYSFEPVERSYENLTSDRTDQNYIGTLPQYTLTVEIDGKGRVEGDGEIDCPGVCSQTFDKDTLVLFSAIADAGYRFDSSSAGQCNAVGDCSLTLTEDTTIIITFVEDPDITPTPNPDATPNPDGTPMPDPSAVVPEPGTIILLGLGLLGLLGFAKRRSRKN